MNRSILLLLSSVFLLSFGCIQDDRNEFLPVIWTRYDKVNNYEDDFKDLVSKGVQAVEIRVSPDEELLSALRKYNLKVSVGITEITQKAWLINQDEVERSVMIGGTYKGLAIDRFRFAFAAGQHTITIGNPVYSRDNIYGPGLGHYFPAMHAPLKAEVIVKKMDFDGMQHLQILPAEITPYDSIQWNMHFDLTGVEGDLENVILAVYWISEGSRKHWILGDGASAYAPSTKVALSNLVQEKIAEWKNANGGIFPSDLVFAMRFGDECFHITGHLNSPECSYPLWDYSESAINEFQKIFPGVEYPRGKAWSDVFGRDVCAGWMYLHHKSCSELFDVVRQTLHEEKIHHLKLFRNLTRFDVFHEGNDHDGTGLELLVKACDIAHIDPYPVSVNGYKEDVIPRDMNYINGLARRFNKPVIPWLQSHIYGGLSHPVPADITRMVQQHYECGVDGIMWLGYGPGNFNTFPVINPEAWEEAGRQHAILLNASPEKQSAKIAIIRPYNVRALRDRDRKNLLDYFITDNLISCLVNEYNQSYDAFEPLSLSSLDSDELEPYDLIIAAAGNLSNKELNGLFRSGKKCVVFIFEADTFGFDPVITGIQKNLGRLRNDEMELQIKDQKILKLIAADLYALEKEAVILGTVNESPVIWQKNNIVFVSAMPEIDDHAIIKWLYARLKDRITDY